MKLVNQQIVDHCNSLIKLLTTCMRPVLNENSAFVILSIGYGDNKLSVTYDKQAYPGEFTDEIRENTVTQLFVMIMMDVIKLSVEGKMPYLVNEWKTLEEKVPDNEKNDKIVFSPEELWDIVYKEANKEPQSIFLETVREMGLSINETEVF